MLWKLLEQSWNFEHESMLPRRPPISLLRAQLGQDGETWVSAAGISRATTFVGECFILSLKRALPDLRSPQADDTTPFPAVSEADPDLQALLERVHDFLRLKKSATVPARVAVPTLATIPDLIAASSSVLGLQVPPREPERGKPVKTHTRKSSLRKIQDRFKLLLAKFSRVSRRPVTLSDGLIPEREENAEASERRYAKLFG